MLIDLWLPVDSKLRTMMETLVRDLRLAARGLFRNPGFTTLAIITLALGIGATTAVFSVFYGVLVRPLPFPNADRLVRIVQVLPARGAAAPTRAGLTLDQIAEWQATSRTLSAIGFANETRAALTRGQTPVLLRGSRISVGLLRAIGVPPRLGRLFVEEDAQPGNTEVVILSHQTWTTYFGSDPDIFETSIVLNDRPHRVIGVMADSFSFPSLANSPTMSLNSAGELAGQPEFWMPQPARPRPGGPAAAGGGITLVSETFALLRAGGTIEQATAEANTLMAARADDRFAIEIVSARAEQARGIRPILLLFQTGVVFVLFIACLNVINLLLARAGDRRRELAIRLSLGATRAQITRHAVAEGLLLAISGGALGTLLAFWILALFRTLPPYLLPRMDEIRVDMAVLAFTLTLSVCSGIVVGLATALGVLRGSRSGGFQRFGEPLVAASRPQQPSRLLVVAEISAGIVLLAGAGLLLTSFAKLMRVGPGFEPSGVFTFRVSLPQARYPTAAMQHDFNDQLSSALERLPGVESVAAGNAGGIVSQLSIDGLDVSGAIVAYQTRTPGFVPTLRIPLLKGRDFLDSDRAAQATVALVNETFARRYFGDADPVGRRVRYFQSPELTIVGVVGDTKPLRFGDEIRPEIYLPQENESAVFGAPTYIVRTSGDPTALLDPIRAAVRRLDENLVVSEATTMEALLGRHFTHARVYSATSAAFALVAVALAAIGLYSVLAYSIGRRTREIGIRIALGAQRHTILAGVLRDGMAMVALGIAAGVAGALYLSRFLETMLFGVTPHDPVTLGAVVMLFTLVALLACYIPSRRAMRVDPVVALRVE